MICIVMVTASEGQEPEPVGPFPDNGWAKRYVERVKARYFKMEVMPLLSPVLLNIPASPTEPVEVVFDPSKDIDR